uniref:Tetratricopeptide repeat protein SKI3 n=1 Tax=Ananas comosus var. bracteatus TaxID=296719 RepID=A0A6V7QSG7_ANACO
MPETVDDDLFEKLQQTLESDPNNPNNHYNLALFLWKKGEESEEREESKRFKERAAEHFLTSAKLNPNEGAAFRFLGHFYGRVAADAQRASKCYQRAVTLNPRILKQESEGLCDLLDGEGKESLVIAVCKEASDKSPKAFWAFRRSIKVDCQRQYKVFSMQYEALGLAYHRLGMFTAAIKSYGRAIELEGSRIFALVESGNIQLMLRSFRKVRLSLVYLRVEQFSSALETVPNNLAAQFGLASGLLGWSRQCITSGAFGWGATLLKEAAEAAKACTSLSGNQYSAWKLQGDIQIAYAKCFPWEDKEDSPEVDEKIFKVSIDQWKNTCLLAANSAKCSYQRALHLAPWQANLYADIAMSVDLIYSMEEKKEPDPALPEKMCLGALLLEPINKEFWVILGCLSSNHALKQHSFIRGLQLDISLSEAWAYLGKFYESLGEKLLARQAFDRARSIDPSLALPWAGMSVGYQDRTSLANESFESCLRAVQILPLAEFQVGLGTIAILSGHLLSPQVFGAIRQAVQRAPHYPESHNLNGLVCEAQSDYQSAVTAYRHAKCALAIMPNSKADINSHLADVSFNLVRSLCKAGLAFDAAQECEDLKRKGFLDIKGLQIYAVIMWKLGQYDSALTIARSLAKNVLTMNQTGVAAAIGLISSLIYSISGKESAIAVIQKLPSQFLESDRMRLIISALSALGPSMQLQLSLPSMFQTVVSYGVVNEIHSIIALSKMISSELNQDLRIDHGVNYLRKVLHMYPDSSLLRSQLGSLLLSRGDRMAPHKAVECAPLSDGQTAKPGFKSPDVIHGAAVVSCYACRSTIPKFSFSTCPVQHMHQKSRVYHLQRWLHREPWNRTARYLLILNLLQKAREEKFPERLCIILKRLLKDALSNESYLEKNKQCQYEKFILLLSASEISLQSQDFLECISCAKEALGVNPLNTEPFFAHLQLCRAYALQGNISNLRDEYANCLRISTTNEIGWVMLKYLVPSCQLEDSSDAIVVNLQKCIERKGNSSNYWVGLLYLACAQCFVWAEDYVSAEQALAQACAEVDADSCLLLCHGAICMELARRECVPQFLSRALSSLTKAQKASPTPLPIVSLLLAQVEASLGSKAKWERNLRLEWSSWPPAMRPAELYFQMHLLAMQSSAVSGQHSGVESSQSPERWLLRAIHLNPSCLRYWKVLQKLVDS